MDCRDFKLGLQEGNFWFIRKTEFIYILLKKLNLSKDIKILNVGAGTGNDIHEIRKFGKVYVMDIDPIALEYISNDLVKEKKVADACNIPYKENSFDLVLSFDVLEHIKDDFLAVNEIKRVLKPGGIFIFTVPAYNFLYGSHDKYLGHYRRYNRKKINALMKDWRKIQLGNWLFFLFLPALIHRILNKKSEYKFLKIPKFCDFIGNKILLLENFLFKKGLKYPLGLSFYGIYKK